MSPQDSGAYRNFQEFHNADVERANRSAQSSPKARKSEIVPHLSCIRQGPPRFPGTHKHFSYPGASALAVPKAESVGSPIAGSFSSFGPPLRSLPFREASPITPVWGWPSLLLPVTAACIALIIIISLLHTYMSEFPLTSMPWGQAIDLSCLGGRK